MLELVIKGQTAHLKLNRPQKLNALSLKLMEQMRLACGRLAIDSNVRSVVLTGAGRMFCAGADIKAFAPKVADPQALRRYFDAFEQTVQALAALSLPTVAGIHGGCYGGGVSLAMACDLRVGDASCRFGLPPARLGLNYGASDMRRLIRTVGHATATDMLIAARQLEAEQAHSKGLLQYLCDEGQVESAALQLGEKLAAFSLSSIGHSKQMLDALTDPDLGPKASAHFVDSADITDGVCAFGEGRPAKFGWHPAGNDKH